MRDVIIRNGGEVNNYIGDAFVELSGYRDPVQIEWTKNNE